MRRFQLVRLVDLTGISGTGVVAEGVAFSDGSCALRWLTGEHRSTALHDSVRSVRSVHGHEGRTRIEWLDTDRAPRGALAPVRVGEGGGPAI